MKTNLQFLLCSLLPAALFFQSCGPKYGPAYLGSSNAYLAKPAWKGENANAFCLSGRVNKGIIYYEGEKNNTYEFSGHISLMRRHFYYSGGLFGYWGAYELDADASDAVRFTPYGVSGFGQRHEIGVRIPLDGDDNFDALLGLNAQFFSERGKFSKLTNDEAGDVVTKILLFPFVGPDIVDTDLKNETGGGGTGLSADFRYTPSAKRYFGLRYSWDSSKGEGYFTSPVRVHQVTLHGTINNVTVYGQIGFGGYKENAFTVQAPLLSAGLAYSIPFGKKK